MAEYIRLLHKSAKLENQDAQESHIIMGYTKIL